MKSTKGSPENWAVAWLDSVVAGGSTMSQRKMSSIESRGGGVKIVRRLAKERGLHLLSLIDDRGTELIAASTKPFKVIC